MKKAYVEWYDAYTRDAWDEIGEKKEICKPLMLCSTVGWLLDEDENHVTICHTYNELSCMGALHIPRGMIKKIKVFGR